MKSHNDTENGGQMSNNHNFTNDDFRKKFNTLSNEARFNIVLDEIDKLGEQIDAHRIVLAWLIHQQSNNEGNKFLTGQANIIDDGNYVSQYHQGIIEELDAIRDLASSLCQKPSSE